LRVLANLNAFLFGGAFDPLLDRFDFILVVLTRVVGVISPSPFAP
jgi:hypothetical protein